MTTFAAGAERTGGGHVGPGRGAIVFTQVAGATAPRRIAFVAPDGSGLRGLDDQVGFMARLQP